MTLQSSRLVAPANMRLGRVIGYVGLFGLAIIASSLGLVAVDLRARIERDAARDVQSTAYLLADHAGRLVEVADVALRGATSAIDGLPWDEVALSNGMFQQLLAIRSALPYVEDVWLNDEAGLLRLTSFAYPTPPSNAADRDAFKAQLRPTDRVFIGERIVGRVTGRPTFMLARRLENSDRTFRGMASVTADLSYFTDYWSRVPLPVSARVTLVRADTLDVLSQHPRPPEGGTFVPPPSEDLRRAVAGAPDEGAFAFASAQGSEPRFAAYRRVGNLPLLVTVSYSQATLDQAWLGRMRSYGAFATLAGAAFAALTGLGFRQARRDMAATVVLEDARAALATANADLEATVVERTAALRTSETRFRLIVESATDVAIVTTDMSGIVTHWNEGARNVLGWTPAEAVGQSARMIFTPEDQDAGIPNAELGTALTEGRAADERWHVRKDGSRFFATGALLPMRGEGGVPVGFLKILRDRTREFEIEQAERDLKETLARMVEERTADLRATNERLVAESSQRERVEEQLRQSQKMEAVGRLTGGVAHDFNNLLTVVTGNLDMLRRRMDDRSGAGPPDARVQRLINQAIEGANRAAALTYRLLAFSRQQPLSPEPVDANKLLSGMSDLLRRTLGENVAVETVLAGGLWRTHVDPNGLENAVLNLAVNARDAMPDGGKLTIESANAYLDDAYAASRPEVEAGQYVLIAVCDTGLGMSAETLAKAFEPFFTTKPVGKGTGLGLSQVYGFVKQSRGHAEIYSEVDHGTTVKLYLPRFRQAEARDRVAAHPPRPRLHAARGQGETILVIEDEPMVREFSVSALEDAGYRALAAEDGPSGLALLDAHPEVELLFTDVVLTGPMNGRKVADEALKRRPQLRVLFTTGYTRNAIIHHGRLDEGVNLIGKPFSAADLAEKILQVLTAPA